MYNKLELKLDISVPTIKCQGGNYCPCSHITPMTNYHELYYYYPYDPIHKVSNYSIEIPVCINLLFLFRSIQVPTRLQNLIKRN